MLSKSIVTKEWLRKYMANPKVKLLDCSWYMPALKHPVEQDFLDLRLKGARRFDVDTICDRSTTLPHMLPPQAQFEEQVSALGISNESVVVCYDLNQQYMGSARVWWTFKVFGHDEVYVLDKGVSRELYKDDEALLESGPLKNEISKGQFLAREFRRELLVTLNQILRRNEPGEFGNNVVDARSADRFYARVPEPRAGIQGGHIPDTFNVPFGTTLRDGSFLPVDELRAVFQQSGLDLTKPVVTTCGTGITASVLSLALSTLGVSSAVYDGSWTEYGNETLGLPVQKE